MKVTAAFICKEFFKIGKELFILLLPMVLLVAFTLLTDYAAVAANGPNVLAATGWATALVLQIIIIYMRDNWRAK